MAVRVVMLRPYQLAAIEATRACWGDPELGHPMVVLPTGTGKTATALRIVCDEVDAGGRVVWLAHEGGLLTQPYQALPLDYRRHAGIVKAARDDCDRRIVFASFATLRSKARRTALLAHGRPTLVVVDEAHLSTARTHRLVIDALGAPKMLGLTATPNRADGGDLSELWEIAHSYPITDALGEGYLVAPWASVVRLPDLDTVLASVSGRRDYNDAELGAALMEAKIVEHTVSALLQHEHEATRLPDRGARATLTTHERRWLVYCATVEQSRATAEALIAAGWPSRYASGETSDVDRRSLLAALRDNRIRALCSPTIFTTGTDEPSVDGIVLARPTRSWSLALQCIGRGLRLHDPAWKGPGINAHHPDYAGKQECLVVDLAGATEIHDLRSAPVLLAGGACPESDDDRHRFQPDPVDPVKGACECCGKTVPCLANLGPHEWVDSAESRRCKHCDRPQCKKSQSGRHDWTPAGEVSVCVECGAEMRARGAMQTAQSPARCPDSPTERHAYNDGACVHCAAEEPPEGRWLRIHGVTEEAWAIDVDTHGTVFVVVDRAAGVGVPYWLRHRGRKPRPLSNKPRPLDEVRAWTADLVRKGARTSSKDASWRIAAPTAAQRRLLIELATPYAGAKWLEPARQVLRDRASTRGHFADEITRIRARLRAIATGLAHDR